MATERCTLVATLGGQPQVVTFALDILLARGEPIDEVVVLHLGPEHPRFGRALQRLSEEFVGDCYQGRRVRFRRLLVSSGRRRLLDIRDERDAEAAFEAVHMLFRELRTRDRRLHVCVAGGRRILALLIFAAAQLHFTHQDRLWHLYTPDEVQERARDGALMHVRPEEGVRLIQVPVVPWGAYFPALRNLTLARPFSALSPMLWNMPDDGELRHCRRVVNQLTPRQREVLRAFAEGLSPSEVSARLHMSPSTVDTHKTRILSVCREVWGLAPDQRLTYHFMREQFGGYVAQQDR